MALPFEEEHVAARKAAEDSAAEMARLHAVFVTDDRAAKLLEYWKQMVRVRTPVNASIQEYASKEALRAFVEKIEDEIAKARMF